MASLTDEQLEKEFKRMDKNNDKTITIEELKNFYGPRQKMLGMTDEAVELEIKGLVQRLDTDNNGKISFEEFKKFMSRS